MGRKGAGGRPGPRRPRGGGWQRPRAGLVSRRRRRAGGGRGGRPPAGAGGSLTAALSVSAGPSAAVLGSGVWGREPGDGGGGLQRWGSPHSCGLRSCALQKVAAPIPTL